MAFELFGWRVSRTTDRAPTPGADAPPAFSLPKALEWYLDGAKWLIAIATGMLAFSLQTIKGAPQGMAFWVFLVAAGFLVLMIGLGIWYLWTSYYYAALREGGAGRDDAKVIRFKARSDQLFQATFWSFIAGMVLFVAFHATYLVYPPAKDPPPLQLHVGGATIVAQRGERLWTMTPMPHGAVAWRKVPPPK